MFSFFKKNKKQKPAWSPFDTIEKHEKFMSLVVEYFKGKGISHQIENGIVKIPNEDFGLSELGLQNIAQFCQNEGEAKFKDHIAGHFETLIRGYEFSKKFETLKKDYHQVRDYIGIRIQNQQYIEQIGLDKTIGKSLGGNLFAMLVYDLPDTVTSVPPKEAESWGIPSEEIWKNGLQNTLSKYPPNIMDRALQGIQFKTVEEDHFFSPNIVFNIGEYPELNGIHGSIISTPTRHIVIIYPINDLSVVNAINTQIQVTNGVSAKGPGTLSNSLFWFHKGELIEQPIKVQEGKIAFTPTEDFVTMLNGLQKQ